MGNTFEKWIKNVYENFINCLKPMCLMYKGKEPDQRLIPSHFHISNKMHVGTVV